MNDAQYEGIKDRVIELATDWVVPLGLDHWRMEYAVYRDGGDFDRSVAMDAYMCCEPLWQYEKARISVNAPEVLNLSDEEIEFCLVHELVHVILSELATDPASEQGRHEEHVATVLARALIAAREVGQATLTDASS